MNYKNLLLIVAICTGCGPALAQPGGGPPDIPSQDRIAQDRQACEADVKRLCSNGSMPRPGDPKVMDCMLAHKAELSEACRKNIENIVPPKVNRF